MTDSNQLTRDQRSALEWAKRAHILRAERTTEDVGYRSPDGGPRHGSEVVRELIAREFLARRDDGSVRITLLGIHAVNKGGGDDGGRAA
ncbi:hypothetical protein [Engelhardtia mirabilis]|uniref:Uncharacterized protein n=1 Tax=Engelhardtia mirabilis TaxID=2528011 RepID=A0A518BL12_9BACT|nr:hypothetical protein Pla133_27440 [Planctomycetes bacterium Pla133]QDV01982.1 hypothetical protein Pla86_27430 [Planctomycetes bacterium Pla86]